ncbi:MAG: TonB-dependent receptor [Reichenbachiella sp.]
MKKILTIFLICVLWQMSASAQHIIKGKVTDDTGESLPGVNILLKGSTTGTITDVDGNYNLEIPDVEGVLLISYVGYISIEENVAARVVLDFALQPDAQQLDEIVVIGYGTVKKSDLTGAVSSVKGEEIGKAGLASLDQALAGRAAGVFIQSTDNAPGASTQIRIRGANSINASSEPLYVIDGFPVMNEGGDTGAVSSGGINPMSSLNPNDIASVDILKDASATAIYGARGANGVIIITTKSGKAGETKVNLDVSHGIQTFDEDKYKVLDTQGFADFRNAYAFTYPTAHDLTDEEAQQYGNDYKYWDTSIWADSASTDWMDEISRTGQVMSYNLGINGGSESTTFNVGLGYYSQEGVIKYTDFERYSLSFNIKSKLSEKATFGLNSRVSYAQSRGTVTTNAQGGETGSGIVMSALRYKPNVPAYDEFGNPVEADPDAESVQTNPFLLVRDADMTTKFANAFANAYFEFEILDGLKFKTSGGINYFDNKRLSYYPSHTSWGLMTGGRGVINNFNSIGWLNENTLSYFKQFNSNHQLNLLAGTSIQHNSSFYNNSSATQFPLEDLTYYAIQNGEEIGAPISNGSDWGLLSYFGRVNYTLMSKYILTASFRADGSSRVSNPWGYFPSAAIAWRLYEEDFIKSINFISDMKLRAGFGMTGNSTIPPYQEYTAFGSTKYAAGGNESLAVSPTRIGNKELEWETTSQWNIGLDFGFANNRISGSIEAYQKTTTDMLLNSIIPSSTGYANLFRNIGEVKNEGYELSLNTQNFIGAFEWSSNLNISQNKNKIVELGGEDYVPVPGSSPNARAMLIVGQPVGVWYGFETDGIWQQDEFEWDPSGSRYVLGDSSLVQSGAVPGKRKYKDVNGDGEITADDMKIIGKSQPKFQGGLTNNFSYKGFDLSVFLEFSIGKDVFNANKWWLVEADTKFHNKLDVDYWTPTVYQFYEDTGEESERVLEEGNPSNEYPRVAFGDPWGAMHDAYIEDGSYLRLKNINVGYTLPESITTAIKVQSVRFYATIQNLHTWTKYSGYDPAVDAANLNGMRPGYDFNAYPLAKSYIFGMNINF